MFKTTKFFELRKKITEISFKNICCWVQTKYTHPIEVVRNKRTCLSLTINIYL